MVSLVGPSVLLARADGLARRPFGSPRSTAPRRWRFPRRAARELVGSVMLGFEPAFGVDGGHAARTGGGDGLAVGVVLHVATHEHALDVRRRRAGLGDQVPVVVHLEDALEQVG